MEITIKRHRRNLSYEDAATLDELWELSIFNPIWTNTARVIANHNFVLHQDTCSN